MSDSNQVSIITVTHNSLAYTELFLRSLRQNISVGFDLLVVDNDSHDGTVDFLSKQDDLVLIKNQENNGYGPACNQAFEQVQTPYTLVVNNDTYFFPGFVKALLTKAENYPQFVQLGVHSNCIGASDPRSGKDINQQIKQYQPEIKTLDSLQTWLDEYYQDQSQFLMMFSQKQVQKFGPKPKLMEVPPNFIGGWAFLIKTDVAKQVGGLFDPRFKIGFFEDVDLSWRLAQESYKLGLARDLYLHHFNHVSFDQAKPDLDDHEISKNNALRFADKWGDTIKDWLTTQLEQGQDINDLIHHYHLIRLFLKQADEETQSQVNQRLEEKLSNEPDFNFKQFLLSSNQDTNKQKD
jgi:GT2 family glycosyltransferase